MFTEGTPYPDWSEDHWQEALRRIVKLTLRGDETADDVMAGGWALGKRRSELLSRDFIPQVDATHGLMFFCWIFLKPPVLPDNFDYLTSNRWRWFRNASSDPNVTQNLIEVVPEGILRLDTHQLQGVLQHILVSRIIDLDPGTVANEPPATISYRDLFRVRVEDVADEDG